jgi:hypothetical protein
LPERLLPELTERNKPLPVMLALPKTSQVILNEYT